MATNFLQQIAQMSQPSYNQSSLYGNLNAPNNTNYGVPMMDDGTHGGDSNWITTGEGYGYFQDPAKSIQHFYGQSPYGPQGAEHAPLWNNQTGILYPSGSHNGEIGGTPGAISDGKGGWFIPQTFEFSDPNKSTGWESLMEGIAAGSIALGGGAIGGQALGLLGGGGGLGGATGAFDMGIGGIGEAMGLGDAAWGVNAAGGGMDNWDLFGSGLSSVAPGLGGGTSGFLTDLAGSSGLGDIAGNLGSMGGTGGSWWDKLLTQAGNNPMGALNLLGKLGATGLGMYGANQQSNQLQGLADQYLNLGAPYRNMLASSYANPSAFLQNSPDIQASVDQGTNALARSLSQTGNPAQNGRALHELQNYATNSLYGQLGNERNRLANFGGLSSFNQAAPQLGAQSINAGNGVYNALGYGLSQVTQPQPSLTDLMKMLQSGGLA